MGNPRVRYEIRLVAGAYVIYLAVKIAMDLVDKKVEDVPLAISTLAIILFVVAGSYFAISSIIQLKKIYDEDKRLKAEEAAKAEAERMERNAQRELRERQEIEVDDEKIEADDEEIEADGSENETDDVEDEADDAEGEADDTEDEADGAEGGGADDVESDGAAADDEKAKC
jgi:hypothetical protein